MEFWEIFVELFVSFNQIINCGTAEEILLLKSKLFSSITRIVWIEYTSNVFCLLSFTNSSVVITLVEWFKVKFITWLRSPKSQVICVKCVVSWHGGIISYSQNLFSIFPSSSLNVTILIFLNMTIESDRIYNIISFNFPGISSCKPEIWILDLITIFNLLLKNAIVISNTVAPCWNF